MAASIAQAAPGCTMGAGAAIAGGRDAEHHRPTHWTSTGKSSMKPETGRRMMSMLQVDRAS
jgi:hypothetical protein